MKAAIGNTLVLNIIVTFLSVVLLIIISSIVYTKAYRIKNRIIDEIEKAETYNVDVDASLTSVFREIGYKTNNYMDNTKCKNYVADITENCNVISLSEFGCVGKNNTTVTLENKSSVYHYCVFKIESDNPRTGYYYKVVSFAYLDLPLVSAIEVPVKGETKIFYKQ